LEAPSMAPSKVSTSVKPAQTKPKGRFFEEKEEDLLHAAIQESLKTAKQAQKTPVRAPRKPHGIMKRVLSEASDYGDFDAYSQELLEALEQVENK
jgi:hypothetical protein